MNLTLFGHTFKIGELSLFKPTSLPKTVPKGKRMFLVGFSKPSRFELNIRNILADESPE
jgi:hypothetical protein